MNTQRLINKAALSYISHRHDCDKITVQAQKYIDWDNDIGCEYFPSDGVCLTTTDSLVCPATSFFSVIEKEGSIDHSKFKSICV